METHELMFIIAIMSSIVGSMFSAIFRSLEALVGTQLFAILMAVLGGLLYYYF